MNKKLLSLFMAILLVLSCFAGCMTIEEDGGAEEETTTAATDAAESDGDTDDISSENVADITGHWFYEEDSMFSIYFDADDIVIVDLYGEEEFEGSYTFDGENLIFEDVELFTGVTGYIDEDFNLLLDVSGDEMLFIHESMIPAIYESEDEVYDYFASEQCSELCYDITPYEERIEEITAEYIEEGETFSEAMDKSSEPSERLAEVIAEANQYIIDYFNDTYSISVEDELAALKVYVFEFEDGGPGGVYYLADEDGSDGKTIFLDNDTVADFGIVDEYYTEEDWKAFVYEIYVHETMHYLGSCCTITDTIDWMYVFEGMTVAWTQHICELAGYGFEDGSMYRDSTVFAQQLLFADHSFVEFMIEGDSYVSPEELTAYFDSVTFEGFGETYQKLMTLVIHEEDNEEFMLAVQHMLGEYLKGLDLDKDTQLMVADLFVAPISELA